MVKPMVPYNFFEYPFDVIKAFDCGEGESWTKLREQLTLQQSFSTYKTGIHSRATIIYPIFGWGN